MSVLGVVEPGPVLRHNPFYVVCEPSHLKCKKEGKPTIRINHTFANEIRFSVSTEM